MGISTCFQLELALQIGSRYDLRPALDQANDFLAANVKQLSRSCDVCYLPIKNEKLSVWRWLQLADKHVMSCLTAVVRRAVEADRAGCSNPANIGELSAPTLKKLVTALVPGPCVVYKSPMSYRSPGPCSTCKR
jgi:hypothetical protein